MQTNIYFVCPISVLLNQIYQEKKINKYTHTHIYMYILSTPMWQN